MGPQQPLRERPTKRPRLVRSLYATLAKYGIDTGGSELSVLSFARTLRSSEPLSHDISEQVRAVGKRRISLKPLILPPSSHELLPKHAKRCLSSFAHRPLLAQVLPRRTNTARRRHRVYLSGLLRTSSIRTPTNPPQSMRLQLPNVGG
jgi:hypothetical protein